MNEEENISSLLESRQENDHAIEHFSGLDRAYDVISKSFNINLQKTSIVLGFASLILSSLIIFLYDGHVKKQCVLSNFEWILIVVILVLLTACCLFGLYSLFKNVIYYEGAEERKSCSRVNKKESIYLEKIKNNDSEEMNRLVDLVFDLNSCAVKNLMYTYLTLGVSIVLMLILLLVIYLS